jgi:hypothetical protein
LFFLTRRLLLCQGIEPKNSLSCLLCPEPYMRSAFTLINIATRLSRPLPLLLLCCLPGCLSWVHPIPEDVHTCCYQETSEPALVATVPAPCPQSQVHVFFIHGLDPCDLANLRGVREYCHRHGFTNTTLAQFYHGPWVVERIRKIRECDPTAPILIFGFSAGTCTARNTVHVLHKKYGIDVNTVIYTSGITLSDNSYSCPSHIAKVIHIRDCSHLSGKQLSGAENYKYSDVGHFGTPTHPNTLAVLLDELNSLAANVPQINAVPGAFSPSHLDSPAPVSVLKAPAANVPSSWDVVKPAETVASPPPFRVK